MAFAKVPIIWAEGKAFKQLNILLRKKVWTHHNKACKKKWEKDVIQWISITPPW